MSAAISVRNLGKRFIKARTHRIPALSALQARVTGRTEANFFWALRDVSFDIEHGERVAILGRNGAGKTTLLRLIAGAMLPTRGTIRVDGTIAPLFGVGTGFHNELSGRENVILAGAMYGISRPRVEDLMPSIEDFAEIGDFIDSPIKHYSSGMKARLGFALMDQIDASIMLLDEILSVGDKEFKAKSAERLRSRIDAGKTVVLVTHSAESARTVCDRAVVVADGVITNDGRSEDILRQR